MKRDIYVADCETNPFDGRSKITPFIWGLLNIATREYRQFYSTREFLDYVKQLKCICYAHNGGKFDWHFILYGLAPFTRMMIINGRLAKFVIGECEFRDSWNIMPMPLSAVEKDKVDYSIFTPDKRVIPANRDAIERYLLSDCVHLADMVQAFINEFGLHLTQAGASVKAWERITNQKAPETDAAFFDAVAPYYYGGRVQCFETGIIEREFKVVDINSAYPFAMMHHHPWGDAYGVSNELPNSRGAIQRAFITLDAPSRGAFPWREQRGRELTFPDDGEVRTFQVTGWEFLAALETGSLPNYDIKEVLTLALSQEFSTYLNHFYKMKTDAKAAKDKARYEFSKRFLNSLYGKMGANPDEYEEFQVVEPHFIDAAKDEEGYEFKAELGSLALVGRPLAPAQKRYYNVATASSITGFVRAYLWRAIKQCTAVSYCDTDCVVCADTGRLELHGDKLGAWDIEAECNFGAIAGKKLYAFHKKDGGWKKASKGVKLSTASIIRVARGARVVHNPLAPTFSLSRGQIYNSRAIKMRS